MNYSVVWVPSTEQELAATWLAAADRNAVTAASHALDRDLAQDPHGRGIPRRGTPGYIAVELPLGVEYEVVEADKTVRVLHVWSLV